MKHKKIIEHELEGFGIRLNKRPPNVEFKIKPKGGINITHMVENPDLDDEMIKTILKEYKINSVDIIIREKINEDQIIDIIEGDRKYIPCLYVMNKIDDLTIEELDIID